MATRDEQLLQTLVDVLPENALVVSAAERDVVACGPRLRELFPIVVGDHWDEICLDPLPLDAPDPVALRFGNLDQHALIGATAQQVDEFVILQPRSADSPVGWIVTSELQLDADLSIVKASPGIAALFDTTDAADNFASLTRTVYAPDIAPLIDHLMRGSAESVSTRVRQLPVNAKPRLLLLNAEQDIAAGRINVTVTDVTATTPRSATTSVQAELFDAVNTHAEPWVLYEASSGLILSVNKPAHAAMGYSCADLRELTDAVLWQDPARREEWVSQLVGLNWVEGFPAVWIHSDGSSHQFEFAARILPLDDLQVILMHLGRPDSRASRPFADPHIAAIVSQLAPYGEFDWQVTQDSIQGTPKFFAHLGTDQGQSSPDAAFAGLNSTAEDLAAEWSRKAAADTAGFVDTQLLTGGDHQLRFRVAQIDDTGTVFHGIVEPPIPLKPAASETEGLESRLAAIFNASPTPVLVTGPDRVQTANVILEVNPAACALFSCSADELVGQSTQVLFDHNHQEFARVRAALAQGKGRLHDFATEITSSAGTVIPVLLNNRLFTVGGIVHGLWQLTDQRQRKASEQALIVALRRLEQAQSIGQIGDFQWNIEDGELHGSLECLRVLGIPPEDIRDGEPFRLEASEFLGIDKTAALATLHRVVGDSQGATEHSFNLEVGHNRHVHGRGFVEQHEDGSRWLVGTVQDITERYEAERQKREMEAKFQETQRLESLGMLAGGVAHDFNNLLVGITGNADLALLDHNLPQEARERIQDVLRAARRAADLTRQLLAYSGKGRFVVEPTDVNEVVRDISQLLEVTTSKNSILRYQLAEELPAIECDVTQIRQVIMNLIVNASEAIVDRQGVVTVGTGIQECSAEYLKTTHIDQEVEAGRYVFFEVNDTGQGMDNETMSRIFEPFFSTKFAGRGLGLAAVLGIIKGHQGTLKVYSEVGRGTNMKVLLPAVDATPTSRISHDHEYSWVGEGTVLVIDDELSVRELAKRILEPRGFAVLTAKDGEEGLELFRAMQQDVRVVILDLTMPRMNGEECFWELRQIRPDIKVILISGYNEQEATSNFVGRGLSDFVAKPFVSADLLRAVSRALAPPGDPD